jgi:microcystin-dependent protein
MSDPFLGDIKLFGFGFAPRGYALCDGQLLPIAQNQSLYSLLGTTFGGNGSTDFALPDLRGRAPIHPGTASSGARYQAGQAGGEERQSLTPDQMPPHHHQAVGTDQPATSTSPAGQRLGVGGSGRRPVTPYGIPANLVTLHADTIGTAGNGQGHENMQPFLTISFCIALQGGYPSRS